MDTTKTPSDVVRLINHAELPASVRELPKNDNPLKDGVLMKHQSEWIQLCAKEDLTIAEKGRRTGITYATALDGAITAATRKSAGGDNIYYVGDTKDKGLEFIGYCAHMAKVMAMAMADGWNGIEVFLFEDQQEDGSSKHITAYRIRFATGFQIVALSSNPANIRGLQGIVVIDEAAFHKNVAAVIEACLALIIWGGKIRIISTHNGTSNAFNQLIKDARAGDNQFKVYFVDFDMAVKNGLYERVCFVKGWQYSQQAQDIWYNKIRKGYGTNKAAMREELDAIPREGSGVAIPGILIESVMHETRPILRLALPNEFATKSVAYKKSWCEDWIETNLKPLCDKLNRSLKHVLGGDFARRGDFSIYTPASIEQDLTRKVPFVLELKNVPIRQQEQILWYLIDHLPNFQHGKLDATGNGAGLAEYTADKYGHDVIDQVMITTKWYRETMASFIGAFEDSMLDLPKDADIKNDLRTFEMIDGVIKMPAIRTQDTKNAEFFRHGDAAIALVMMWLASQTDTQQYGYHKVQKRTDRRFEAPRRTIKTTAGFKGRRGIF